MPFLIRKPGILSAGRSLIGGNVPSVSFSGIPGSPPGGEVPSGGTPIGSILPQGRNYSVYAAWEFDGPAKPGDQLPFPWASWTYWGAYFNRSAGIRHEDCWIDGNSNLVLRAIREGTNNYAAMVSTCDTATGRVNQNAFYYGPHGFYTEARVKIDFNAFGHWFGFWTMVIDGNKGNTYDYNFSTGCEVDICECMQSHPNEYNWAIHWAFPPNDPRATPRPPDFPHPGTSTGAFVDTRQFNGRSPMDKDYHLFGWLWEENYSAFYFDGYKIAEYPAAPNFAFQNLILSIEYQSNPWAWGDTIYWDQDPPNPDYVYIDWVRIYKIESSGGGGGGGTTPPPPPTGMYLTGKSALGAYSDITQLDNWLGRRLAAKSFYIGGGYWGYDSVPTDPNHDPNWQSRTYFMVNAPGPQGISDSTTMNRQIAAGQHDTVIRQAAQNTLSVINAHSNFKYAIWVYNEFQCWWNGGDGGYDVPAWRDAVRRTYTIAKEVAGDKLLIALCPSHNWPPNLIDGGTRNCPVRFIDWYPGDDYCDAVGMTLYSTWRPDAPGFNLYGSTWKEQMLDARNDWGPEGMFNFAVQRGKKFFVSEYGPMWNPGAWGYSPPSWYDAEQADFFQFSFDRWLSKPECIGTIFFNDWTDDGYHKMDNLPQAREKFIQLWK